MKIGDAVSIRDVYFLGEHPRTHSGTIENLNSEWALIRLEVPYAAPNGLVNKAWFRISQVKVKGALEMGRPTKEHAFEYLRYLVLISGGTNAAFMQERLARDYYDDCCVSAVDLPNADIHLVEFDHETERSVTLERFGIYKDQVWS